jgi:hypothetical protein
VDIGGAIPSVNRVYYLEICVFRNDKSDRVRLLEPFKWEKEGAAVRRVQTFNGSTEIPID